MEDFMLPCLNKKLFGLECFGCGFQRATALLFRGEFIAAFKMYPAVYTLLLFGLFIIASMIWEIKYAYKIKIVFAILNGVIILVSYFYKMSFLF
ncbi:MAG: DUF2752 domain-containing protein [Patiriisocius sp.]|uniref:DUF2752 domain-containing protein n=1 Tax=Patiriisocius sp. TaxID=2822396 RepID=UPI003EF8A4A7